MRTAYLVQVVSYISPSLKKMAEERIRASEFPLTMSGYISTLLKQDLEKKKKEVA